MIRTKAPFTTAEVAATIKAVYKSNRLWPPTDHWATPIARTLDMIARRHAERAELEYFAWTLDANVTHRATEWHRDLIALAKSLLWAMPMVPRRIRRGRVTRCPLSISDSEGEGIATIVILLALVDVIVSPDAVEKALRARGLTRNSAPSKWLTSWPSDYVTAIKELPPDLAQELATSLAQLATDLARLATELAQLLVTDLASFKTPTKLRTNREK